jgi:hypothetical protein
MRNATTALTAWTPWLALAALNILDTTHVGPHISGSLNLTLVGTAATITLTAVLPRRVAAAVWRHLPTHIVDAIREAPINEALLRGYQLQASHCDLHTDTTPLPRAVGDTQILPAVSLRLIKLDGTTYRSSGDPATGPQPVAPLSPTGPRRPPSPRAGNGGRHR